MRAALCVLIAVCAVGLELVGCAAPPSKRYYTLNYLPTPPADRTQQGPYPYVVRLRELDIEEAYARPQIVYRKSPFELEYYYYRVWAVKPTRMLTDLIQKHLLAANLVSSVVRRYDEGGKPDYELSGTIEAIEEYDSEQVWFAHLALHLKLTRITDGKVLYSRRFDHRKRVFENKPDYVIKEMSMVTEHVLNQLVRDLDMVLAREIGLSTSPPPQPMDADSTTDAPDLWK